MKNIGLYIHVPFCVRKCRYCDFYSVTDLSLTDLYTSAVIRNIKAYGYSFDTVYFGGGTPSLLNPKQIGAILSAAEIAPDAEISMECNPNSVTENYLREVHNAGVNRLSFGVQSFDDTELKMLGRLHDSEQAVTAIETAKKVGFDNISADLMLAVSGQTFESLRRSLAAVAKLPLTHISAYMLKVEEGTPLAADEDLLSKIPDEDDTADMYLEAVRKLDEAGFEQYEISNFARDGFECRHNLKYWRCEEYLGIGPAAHSFIDGARFACHKNLNKFISSEIQKTITLDEGGSAEEKAMLALRLVKEGLPIEAYPENEKRAEMLIRNGLLKKEKGTLRLTPEGCLVSNQIICHLLA
ncbi:MAG: radical SAM family heme chaperone HemW [Oscillospiraceae bacterium]|nr:radical SAM family heme chaperone HemW [Oscillospiraceae bacterium]